MIFKLESLVPEIATWPDEDQAKLVEAARMIASERDGVYHASTDELSGIDRGLSEAESGRFASEAQVAATLARFRTA